ncbi:MAG: hypothetical protein AB8H79_04775 [Myxococcota bacterium]
MNRFVIPLCLFTYTACSKDSLTCGEYEPKEAEPYAGCVSDGEFETPYESAERRYVYDEVGNLLSRTRVSEEETVDEFVNRYDDNDERIEQWLEDTTHTTWQRGERGEILSWTQETPEGNVETYQATWSPLACEIESWTRQWNGEVIEEGVNTWLDGLRIGWNSTDQEGVLTETEEAYDDRGFRERYRTTVDGDVSVEAVEERDDSGRLLKATYTRDGGDQPWLFDGRSYTEDGNLLTWSIRLYDETAEPLWQRTTEWLDGRWFEVVITEEGHVTLDESREWVCEP